MSNLPKSLTDSALSIFKSLVLDWTVFHPQGGGQPADTGFVAVADSEVKLAISASDPWPLIFSTTTTTSWVVRYSEEGSDIHFKRGYDVIMSQGEEQQRSKKLSPYTSFAASFN